MDKNIARHLISEIFPSEILKGISQDFSNKLLKF
jgi:hypothetical protein